MYRRNGGICRRRRRCASLFVDGMEQDEYDHYLRIALAVGLVSVIASDQMYHSYHFEMYRL